jgi:hypothetical protein
VAQLSSLPEVFVEAIASTMIYIPATIFAWCFGVCAGLGLHEGAAFVYFWWSFAVFAGPFVFVVSPFEHHWMFIFWPAVLVPAIKGIYADAPWIKLFIIALLFIEGAIAGFAVG